MMRRVLVVVFGVCSMVSVKAAVPMIEVMSTFYTKETINGVEFMYREEVINGKAKKIWTIDDKEVKQSRYLEAILDAEKEVRRVERVAQEQQRLAQQKEKLQRMLAVYKKELQLKLVGVEQWFNKLHESNLVVYLAFDPQTYENQESFDEVAHLIAQVKTALVAAEDEDTLVLCEHLNALLDTVPERLRDLFYATTDNAIQLCGDTKVLKNLLEIVAQA